MIVNTLQEFADNCYNFYSTGGKPGYDSKTNRCLYINADDEMSRCAIGCQVDIEVAEILAKDHSDKNVYGLTKDKGFVDHLLPKVENRVTILVQLQSLHDRLAKGYEGDNFALTLYNLMQETFPNAIEPKL